MIPAPDRDVLWCQFCGKTQDDAESQQQAATLRSETARNLGEYDPPGADWRIDPDLRRILNVAWSDIQANRLRDAQYSLEEAQTMFADSADLWYLLSLTTHDPGEKRAHLMQALSIEPRHDYAWRDQGILNGVIPADAASHNPDNAPLDPADTLDLDSVDAHSETQHCPLCGGHIAYSAAAGAAVCAHCGHQPGSGIAARPAAKPRRYGYRNLEDALLQRRYGFTREWDIGARLLTCQNCSAQLTLVQDLAAICPFCDSAHVLIEDAAGSFEEPDAILPFKLDRTRAAKTVHARLPDDLRPQIVRGEMWGVYLPYWMFAGTVSLSVPPVLTAEQASVSITPGMFAISDALVAGVTRPTQATLYDLMPYNLDALVPYDRRILSRWSAQIYRTDVIQASITARAYLKYVARGIATGYVRGIPPADLARTDSNAYNPPNLPIWQIAQVDITDMHYRLALLPVWMITLILRDGSRRPAIVNGQTGEAIISARFDRDSIIAGPVRPPVAPLPLPQPARSTPRRKNVIRPISPPPRR